MVVEFRYKVDGKDVDLMALFNKTRAGKPTPLGVGGCQRINNRWKTVEEVK